MIDTAHAHRIRAGDIVRVPGGREVTVAYADYRSGGLSWTGWPGGYAAIDQCELVRAASDEEHYALVGELIRQAGARPDPVERLYGSAYRAWQMDRLFAQRAAVAEPDDEPGMPGPR